MKRTGQILSVLTLLLFYLALPLSAAAQLSRARRAARTPPSATPPAAAVQAPEKQPEPTPVPTPVNRPTPTPATVTIAEPVPHVSAPRQQRNTNSDISAGTATESSATVPKRKSRLSRVREQVRPQSSAVVSPSPQPAPRPAPLPPRHHDRPSRPRRPAFGCNPHSFGRQGFTSHHHHIWSAPAYSQEAVIIQETAPAPFSIPEQPVFGPVESTLLERPPAPDSLIAGSRNGPAPYGCSNDQPDFLSNSCLSPLEFLSFPYQHGAPGIMSRGANKTWSGSALFEYGNSFDGLERKGLGLLVEHSSRLGFDFKWDSYEEDLGGGLTDELRLTDLNVLFRVAQSESYLVRMGIGANILDDAFGTDSGFNVTTKADFFPIEPIVLSAEIDLGTIGEAEMFHAAGRMGLVMDRFELFGGYDYRTIGGVPLQGTMFGVQIWF